VRGTDQPHAHLPPRRLHGQGRLGEGAVEAQVHMHYRIGIVEVEQVLAVGVGTPEHPPIQPRGGCCETALRAGDRHWRSAVTPLVGCRQPVRRMTLRH
jgi:hypothetical protein